ncbi:siderophore-interacting protein [Sciscionella marina]|uniref:siderophore-interacting protein n=1 Tax=Sciscionella marina TaxID=508770 RepID=UPI00036DB81A|nr:siderophore-interacting protein [Sciscionella marina]
MAEKKRRNTTLRVIRTERLTPTMIRVIFGGEELADFGYNGFTDSYVKLLFPKPGVAYPEPFDINQIREELPREQWPDMRTYTVRWLDREAGELAIDFLTHGAEGLAGPWAQTAGPGDRLAMLGPGGAYSPREDVARHLLVGDESALPAIGAAVEALPDGARAHAVIEVAGEQERQPLTTKAELTVTWVHRDGAHYGEKLVETLRGLEAGTDPVHAFVHGEAGAVKQLRGLFRDEWGIPADRLSISGYWRTGMNEDGHQAAKRAEREAEEASAAKS